MTDLCLMKCVYCFDQVSRQTVELPDGPVPDMLSLEADYFTESSIDLFHDQDMTFGFTEHIHACADNVVIDELVEIATGKFGYFFGEINFA